MYSDEEIRGILDSHFNKRNRKTLLSKLPRGGIGAEIGVWQGNFSEKLLKTHPKELHLIDPWLSQPQFKGRAYASKRQDEMDYMYHEVVQAFRNNPLIRIHRGFSQDVLDKFPAKFFDWIYIDGNHEYSHVKADLEKSLQKSKMVCGDDMHIEDVRKAVSEYDFEEDGEGQFIILSNSIL